MSTAPSTQAITKDVVDAFRRKSYPVAKEIRDEAIHHFETLGFPGTRHEEYRFTPIARNIEKIVAGAGSPVATSAVADITPYLIPELEANCIVFVNGVYSEVLSTISSPAHHVKVQSLQKALEEKSPVATEFFAKLVDFRSDGFAAYNTAFWSDGVFVHVSKNTVLEKPLMIIHLTDTSKAPVISPTRLLLVVEENSEVSLIERIDSSGTHPVFHSWVSEIAVRENAVLNYCKIQNDPGNSYQVASTMIHQGSSSKVNTHTITLNGKMIRNNLSIAIDGERCESHFFGLYLLDRDTLADNHTEVDHRKPFSFSNELYKGIMDGNSKGIFNGKIYVRPYAQKTNAFQSNRNVLLTDTATIHTKPQLEIWADDVKCSHGCTSGQLDEEGLFYLQTRGISKENAQAMLLYAFAGEILDPMKDPFLKNYLDQRISERLQKRV